MRRFWARVVLALLPALIASGAARAEGPAGNGVLEKIRKAGVIRVGITNGLPYSILNPDGTSAAIRRRSSG